MTDITKELIEDIHLGDYVQIRYGTSSDQTEYKGTVAKLSENILTLQKEDGEIQKIRLDDNLRTLTKLQNKPIKSLKSKESHLDFTQLTESRSKSVDISKPQILRKMVGLPPAQPYNITPSICVEKAKAHLKSAESVELKKTLSGIIDSLTSAIKNNDIANKYHNLRAKALATQKQCHTVNDYKAVLFILGILSFIASDYGYSLEPLVRVGEYSFAAYSATLGKMTESAQVLSLCALLAKESSDVNQYISEICIERKEVNVLKKLLDNNKNNQDMCEKIASCAMMLFNASGAKLTMTITPYFSAYETATQLLEAIPLGWQTKTSALSWWNEFSEYTYPVNNVNEDVDKDHIGFIDKFDNDKKYGFIDSNCFFYITQVYDNSENGRLLRKMLSLGFWHNLEVVFRLGKSRNRDGVAATAIELTEKGYYEALDRLNTVNKGINAKEGFIEEFSPQYASGKIQSDGKRYAFKISDIIDPWLKAYYEECFSPHEQNVKFEISGKRVINICWLDPNEAEHDMFASSIKHENIQKWEEYLSARNSASGIDLSDVDTFSTYIYQDLPDLNDSGLQSSLSLLNWDGKSIIEPKNKRNNISKSVLQSKENVLPSSAVFHSSLIGQTLAEQGRKAWQQGNFEKAEEYFEKSLTTDGFNETIVCDFISLYMQWEGKIDKAIELLQKYKGRFSAEKFKNLSIGVYEKKKDYSILCKLYEDAFITASSVTKKSHLLFRLIEAYIKLEKYAEALSTCKRWEQFYTQNRFRSDAYKIKTAESAIKRQKAVCLYNLGEKEEAKIIATDLIRANPADAIANSILDETLGKSSNIASEELTNFETDSVEDDFEENPDTQMNRFVRKLINEADIAANLKTPYIKEGCYIGSSKSALDDVEKLSNGTRQSAKKRSDSLFAACKILEQIEQREDSTVRTANEYRMAGRAMASWGDYMVSQVLQLDTTRMAYIYALRILSSSEQDWINSYNRYIKSFFMARVGANSLEEYIGQQTNRADRDGANADIFVGNRIHERLLPEFLVGVLTLIRVLKTKRGWASTFVRELYSRNSELKSSVCHQLELLTDTKISEDVNQEEFKNVLFRAEELFNEKNNELQRIITNLSSVVLSEPLSESDFEKLNTDIWRNYINASDAMRLNSIVYIFKRSQDFFGSSEFENRSDCLRALLVEIKDLNESIQKEPTDISFDVFLPALEQIASKVNEKQINLYQDFLPKLSWRETIQPFKTPDGQIQVQLTVKNEVNYQPAEALTITSVTGSDIEWSDNGVPVQTLRGGDEAELGIIISVKESAISSGSFIAKIAYTYKCSDALQGIIVKNQEKEFTFIIRNENFEPLKNPYIAYEGKVMEDDTMFVGRSTQIQEILDMIRPSEDGQMNYGRAIAMYGQTRTGKSSLIYHLKKKLTERYRDDILIWDIGNIGELEKAEEYIYMANFLYNLLRKGQDAIRRNNRVSKLVEEIGLMPPLQEIRNEPSFAVNLFNEYMDKLNDILRREKKIIVLLLDEFSYFHGYIKEGKLSSSFMLFWKALLQNYCIFAIITAQDDMPEFMREYKNEFACMELRKLNYLDERDTMFLVQEPLENVNQRRGLFRNDGSAHKIYNLTAGSAYLTIILCSKLVTYLNDKGAYMVTKGIVNEFLRTRAFGPNGFLTEVLFEPQLQERGHRELDEINMSILLSVARLSQTTGYANISNIDCSGINRDQIQQYVDRLVDRNVLVKEGDKYYIQVKLLEKWLINTMGE